ncbi:MULTISPECIES: macrolide 2'-phosphotransferase [Brevibacterium]|uniref:Macrolide 2'-phosphotransferase n=1 Tax=Brevibacterium casei TaxID=33889 RepID=A0A7T4DIQ5_9MICO|nr:macrolide 2'-phosphotransferase [Brevibacterium casei]QQB13114.1 macrolide 2'-phosphotransferase [Brevibacterium casei]
MDQSPRSPLAISELAAEHGLTLVPESVSIDEIGLDFRVAFAEAADGSAWVLRIPRRPDVTERADVEGRFLGSVAPHLSVDVPDWQIHTDRLIAYPLLPGSPGLTLDEDAQPRWHFDVEATDYAHSLGDVLAELHAVDPAVVRDSGIPILSPAEVRQQKREDIAAVVREFEVAEDLRERWAAWLDDDRYWPTWSTVTHGEIYPAHQLMEGTRIVGLLDWTTAAVGDPARDFMFHQMSVSPEAFDLTVERYVERGGRVWPKLAEHCAEMFSTAAVDLGLYALDTGDVGHLEAAREQLNPVAG